MHEIWLIGLISLNQIPDLDMSQNVWSVNTTKAMIDGGLNFGLVAL